MSKPKDFPKIGCIQHDCESCARRELETGRLKALVKQLNEELASAKRVAKKGGVNIDLELQ